MRLWHYKLIPYLPKSQLLAQWRELNSIFKKQDKHILINYIYEYDEKELMIYSCLVISEMKKRGYKINMTNYHNYFGIFYYWVAGYELFKNHHDNRYLIQCFYNLQEKFDRGQKDFTLDTYNKLIEFMRTKFEKLI